MIICPGKFEIILLYNLLVFIRECNYDSFSSVTITQKEYVACMIIDILT